MSRKKIIIAVLVIAVTAAVMNLLSVAAAYGVVAYVLEGGWAGRLIGIVTVGGWITPPTVVTNSCLTVPRTGGLNISGVYRFMTGTPITIQDTTFDLDRNGILFDPLPPGSYSGTGAATDTTVEMVMAEFTFTPDTTSVPAGSAVRFRFPNRGQVQHEVRAELGVHRHRQVVRVHGEACRQACSEKPGRNDDRSDRPQQLVA